MTRQTVQSAIQKLSTVRSFRCADMVKLLEGLGFEVRDGKKSGHKVITHPGLCRFTSASFSCGHGRDPQVKRAYIHRIKKVLEDYGEELSGIDWNETNGE